MKRKRREKLVPAYHYHDIKIVSGSLVLLELVYLYSYFKYLLFPSQLYKMKVTVPFLRGNIKAYF